ncbi:MAG: hypothetical protein ACYTXA_05895 [Nostoc sp.]
MKFKADLTDTEGKLRIIEIEVSGKITNCELRQILAKELPGWRLLSTWW